MNKHGFTLVELMVVIVLLGVLSVIAVVSFRSVSERVKQQQYDNKVSLIEMKACEYASEVGGTNLNVDRLVKRGYLQADNENGDVFSPIDGKKMNEYVIKIERNNGNCYAELFESFESSDSSKPEFDQLAIETGDYVYYKPEKNSYTISTELTGYITDQTINPSELSLWRVIRKNSDGTVDIISDGTSSNMIYLNGSIYKHYSDVFKSIAKGYETDNITSSSRIPLKEDIDENFAALNLNKYWMSEIFNSNSRCIDGNSKQIVNFYFLFFEDGKFVSEIASSLTSNDCSGSLPHIDEKKYYDHNANLRPIVTLKANINILSGDGSKSSPWKVN